MTRHFNKSLALLTIGVWLAGACDVPAALFDTWGWRQRITFAGYNPPDAGETLTNFPVLVMLEEGSNGFHYAQLASPANPADLRFTTADGLTELHYEIDTWDTGGVSCVWVQVPTLSGPADSILAYWGNNGVLLPGYTTNGATWSSGYTAVWHMKETSPRDSGSNRYNTTGTSLTLTNGPIGSSLNFNGTSSKAAVTNSFGPTGGQFTFEMWARTTSVATDLRAFESYLASPLRRFIIRLNETSAGRTTYYDSGDRPAAGTGTNLNNGAWHHLVYVLDQLSNSGRIYENGCLLASSTWNMPSLAGTTSYIGCNFNGSANFFSGAMDEVRFSSTLRSSNWVAACYLNQASNRAFLAYSNADSRPSIDNANGPINVTSGSATLTGTLLSTGTVSSTVWVFWNTVDAGTNRAAWTNSANLGQQDLGPVATHVTGLAPNSTYYYTYYATNDYGEVWAAPSKPFVTGDLWVEPVGDASEFGPSAGSFAIHRSHTITSESLTVYYSATGSASNGVDYLALTGSVELAAGADLATVVVMPISDLLLEPAETVTLTLTNGPYVVSAMSNSATLTIAAHDAATWPRYAPITVSGYTPPGGQSPLTNFPLLVALGTNVTGFSYGQFLSGMNDDLRFADASGLIELPYEIESWDTNGTSSVWVQVPVLTNQVTVMALWGRSGVNAPAYTTNGMPWDAHYIGVWHMARTNAQDSTSARAHGASAGTVAQVPGAANGANAFAAGTDYIQVPDSPRFTLSNTAFTVSAWINASMLTNTYAGILGTYNGAGFILALTNNSTRTLAFWAANQWLAAVPIPTSAWKQVAYTRNGSNGVFYVDGVAVKSHTNAVAGSDGGPLRFGNGGTNWFVYPLIGKLDEVRISSTARSSNWMYACWATVASNSAFASVGGVAGTPPLLHNQAASDITTTSASLRGNLDWSGGTDTTVFVYWGRTDGGSQAAGWANTNRFPDPAAVGPLSTNLTGLASNSTYSFTYCASNTHGVTWAFPSETFITGEIWIEKTSDSSEAGLVPGTFTVYRASTATNAALSVAFAQTGGTAVPGTNFVPLSGSLLLPAGSASRTIAVTPLMDYANTSDTTLELTLTDALAPIGPASNALMTFFSDSLVNVWIRPAANPGNASASSNWSQGHAPTTGEIVYLGTNSALDVLWDLTNDSPVMPGRWVQTTAYTGTVTIPTRYPGQGPFTNFAIDGDCLISGGVWTHPTNTGGQNPRDRLAVTVAGNFTLGTGAVINLNARGYAAASGPGAGNGVFRATAAGVGASHGGRGYFSSATVLARTYDSILMPTNLGSGAKTAGGGALDLRVQGTATVDGVILAKGDGAPSDSPAPAGGSVYLSAGTLAGMGTIDVSGGSGSDYENGGGGRIAVIATLSDVPGTLLLKAYGGGTAVRGTAGTVYREGPSDGPGQGTVTIDDNAASSRADVWTPLFPEITSWPNPETTSDLTRVALVLSNRAYAGLSTNLRIRDFITIVPNAALNLNARTLFIDTAEHSLGSGTVITNGGNIVWPGGMIVYELTLAAGPHGTVTTSLNGLYPDGTNVEISATPDPGYGFYRWTGDIPTGQETNSTTTLVMDKKRDLRALFASTNATTRTWLGFASPYATNAANWYLGQLPTNDDVVVLDETSVTNLIWDLDIPLTAWNQQTGYTGTVTIRTKYPGQGAFTNFMISGDCRIEGGSWTHPANTGGGTAIDRLAVTVAGNFALGTGAVINLNSRGYAALTGPGAGNNIQRQTATGSRAASHGGRGGIGLPPVVPASAYGSALAPTNLGSGANTGPAGAGGGALLLTVGGTATVHGTVQADGDTSTTLQPGSSGGSLYIIAGTLAGNGTLSADGGNGYETGGGGRIAVVLTNSDSFGNITMTTFGGAPGALTRGAAGTLYTESKSQGNGRGTLTINNNNSATPANVYTEILNATDLRGVTMILTNRGCAGLAADAFVADLFIRTNTATRLYLNNYTLTIGTSRHADWGHTNWVVYDGGILAWRPGSVLLLR